MKIGNHFGALALLLVMVIAVTVFLQACGDRRESSYATLADADKAGEIARGWVPDCIPKSSYDIHIVYAPSSPRTWCAFEFTPDDSQSLKKNLKNVSVLPRGVQRMDRPGTSWWPEFLNGDLDLTKFRRNGFEAYVAEEPDVNSTNDIVLFAIDWVNGRAFFLSHATWRHMKSG